MAAFALVFVSVATATALGPLPERNGLGLALLFAGGLAWWWCVANANRAEIPLRWIVLGALALRVVALCGDPRTSDDVYRYVWEGEVLARGISPYAFAPNAPELAAVRAELPELAARVGHPDVSAAYPPLVQLHNTLAVCAGRAFDAGWSTTVFLLRVLAATWDLLVLVPLVRLARAAGRSPSTSVAWAWCPLVALEFAGAGHFDALGILLWTTSLAAPPGVLALGAAISVKWLPAAGLATLGRPARAVAVLALVALSFAPVLWLDGGADGLFRGLGQYAALWESTPLLYGLLERGFGAFAVGDPRAFARAAVALAWIGAAVACWRRREDPVRAAFLLTGLFLVLSPTLHPWYVTWIVPFLALFPRPAWCWLAAAAPLFYALLGRWSSEGVWESPAWVWPAVAVPFFALLALDRRRRMPA